MSMPSADEILQNVTSGTATGMELEQWMDAVSMLREDRLPFDESRRVWTAIMADVPQPWPMWGPYLDERRANIDRFAAQYGLSSSSDLYRWSITTRREFWQATVKELCIRFATAPADIVDLSAGVESPSWLPGARLNIVESCFLADAQATAVIVGDPDGTCKRVTYAELRKDTLRVAQSLSTAGFRVGDAIAVMMPMTYESVVIYLGILAAGCVAVSIADSFAAPEVARRLRIAEAQGIFCAYSANRAGKILPIWQRVLEADPPRAVVIGAPNDATLRVQDQIWERFFLEHAAESVVIGEPMDSINILFSSGTTGDPKAILWNQTTPLKCAIDGFFHHDIQAGDVVAWPTNLGWMMGPWLIFASLMNRATIALYHEAPQGVGFGQFIERSGVSMLGIVPTMVRSWRATGCMESCDWSAIRCFSSTGEASNADDMFYLSWLAGFKPIIEYCGGTEIGGGYISSTMVQPNVPAAFSTPALGSQFVILDAEGQPADEGELFLVPPAMGLSVRLLNRDHQATYYEGSPAGPQGEVLRRHGDYFACCRTPYGEFYIAGGRVDDTMNLGGIKVSSAEIEQVLNRVDGISETAAIAVPATTTGPDQLVVFTVLATSAMNAPPDRAALIVEMNQTLRTNLNPLFKVTDMVIVDALPRTASNKVMRRKLRDEYRLDKH